MNHIIAVVGPTASGKSELALQLASEFNGEIVNADSRQIYRYLDIGTAKPSLSDRKLVPHHLVDFVDPDESFSLALYQSMAYEKFDDIMERGNLPFLVGGTGQYIWATVQGWKVPEVAPDYELRSSLEKKARDEGNDALYEMLKSVNPEVAARIDPSNVRRVIRALEITSNKPEATSVLWQKEAHPYKFLIIGLTMERKLLYQRIDKRAEMMIDSGLLEETKSIMMKGYTLDLPSLSGIGYRQMGKVLDGELNMEVALERMKFETHKFARRQYTWFRKNDSQIHWFDVYDNIKDEIYELIQHFITT
jgi:tRNA dimethylallyltransferase